MSASPSSTKPWPWRLTLHRFPVLVRLLFLVCFIWVVNDQSGLYPTLWTKVQGLLVTLLLFLVVGSLGRTVYAVFTVLFACLLAAYFLTLKLYGAISYDLILSMRFTNTAESFGYLSDVLRGRIVLPAIVGTALAIVLLLKSRMAIGNRYFLIASVVILVGLPLAKAYRGGVDLSNKYSAGPVAFSTIPGKLIVNIIQQFGLANELMDDIANYGASYDWSAFPGFTPKQVNIIVIGESSRADFYTMNGFDLFNLTPNIDSTFNYNFSQCLSPASVTVSSLTRTLFLTDSNFNSIPQANLISLFRSQHAKTYWVSNQGRAGEDDSPFSALGMTCDSSYFLNQGSYHFAQEPDRAMLPQVQHLLEGCSKDGPPVAIFVHLMGSHPPLDKRFDTLTIPYKKHNMLAQYMQSVHETDAFIGEILASARKLPEFNMFYFSDHGITYEAKGEYFYHGPNHWENYNVPLVVWTGHDTTHRTINQPISLSNLIDLVYCFNQGPGEELDSLLGVIKAPVTVLDANNQPKAITKLRPNRIEP